MTFDEWWDTYKIDPGDDPVLDFRAAYNTAIAECVRRLREAPMTEQDKEEALFAANWLEQDMKK